MTKCILNGIVKKVIFEDEKKVYLIYEGALWYPVVLEEAERYKSLGYDTYILNVQYEIDSMVTEEILQHCESQ
jgi:hypothetical protein